MGAVSEAIMAENNPQTEFPAPEPKKPWQGIVEVAERLNVKPVKLEDAKGTIVISHEGKSYDVWEIANAFLDRLDEIEQRII